MKIGDEVEIQMPGCCLRGRHATILEVEPAGPGKLEMARISIQSGEVPVQMKFATKFLKVVIPSPAQSGSQ